MSFLLLDADQIAPGLWQGSFPKSGSLVKDCGFDMLVLCARELQPPAESYPGVVVVHAPNDDSAAYGSLNPEKVRTAVSAARQVAQMISSGKKVLVTCAAGMNRSGLVSALALHILYGLSGEACIRLIKRRRLSKDGYQPLSNPDFNRSLWKLRGLNSKEIPDLI